MSVKPIISENLQRRMKLSLATQGGDLGSELILIIERALEIAETTATTAIFDEEVLQLNNDGSTANLTGAGTVFEGDGGAVVGYIRVSDSDITNLELKAPTGSELTIDINADSTLLMSQNLAVSGASPVTINQSVSTTSAVVYASITLGATTLISSILDEDDLVSDSATALATQQSIKAFVASQISENNELDEILANGNITGVNDLIVTAGQKITTDTIDETTAANGVVIDGWKLKDGGAGIITGGTNTFNIANGTASIDIAAAATVDIDTNLTVNTTSVTLDQDLQISASPTWVKASVTGLDIDLDSDGFATTIRGSSTAARVLTLPDLTGELVAQTALSNDTLPIWDGAKLVDSILTNELGNLKVGLSGANTMNVQSGSKVIQLSPDSQRISYNDGTFTLDLSADTLSAGRTVTIPDATGTISLIGIAEDFSGVKTFSATPKTDAIDERTGATGVTIDGVKLKDSTVIIGANQILSAQAATEADPGAITNYVAHGSGAVTVTSNAATDLDTTAAAVDTLEDEITALRASYTSLLAKLRTHGLIAT